MSNSFCETLQSIPKEDLCGKSPIKPLGNFPNQFMTCVYQMNGFSEQYIFVGQSYGYNQPPEKGSNSSPDALLNNNIASVLNVAYDVNDPQSFQVQIQYGEKGFPPFLPQVKPNQYFLTQLAKVGLVDGPENDMMTVVSALYMADQLLHFPTPQQQFRDGMTNIYAPGNLLIHCHDGGSRSVTVAALYIYYRFYANTDVTFESIYTNIICLRWSEATNHHPSLGICQTAFEVLETFSELFPKPVYKVK